MIAKKKICASEWRRQDPAEDAIFQDENIEEHMIEGFCVCVIADTLVVQVLEGI